MQNCFREYPEIYGAEIDNEDEEDMSAEGAAAVPAAAQPDSAPYEDHPKAKEERAQKATEQVKQQHGDAAKHSDEGIAPTPAHIDSNNGGEKTHESARAKHEQVKKEYSPLAESGEVIPKAAYDQTAANREVERK